MKICVLIPVYNESKGIADVVKKVRQRKLDVVVIDDGSTDNSGGLAQSNGAAVIRNAQKSGKGFSLQTGFSHIIRQDYDGVITMDGDGQHAPEDLDSFLKAAQDNPKTVINGNRMANPKGMPKLRFFTNQLMSSLISSVCRQSIPDTQCGYRYISCDILRQIELTSGDFEIETEILIKASKKGFKIISVPIETIYNDAESHIHPVKDTVRFISYFLKEFLSKK